MSNILNLLMSAWKFLISSLTQKVPLGEGATVDTVDGKTTTAPNKIISAGWIWLIACILFIFLLRKMGLLYKILNFGKKKRTTRRRPRVLRYIRRRFRRNNRKRY